jgi:hypothetical protein
MWSLLRTGGGSTESMEWAGVRTSSHHEDRGEKPPATITTLYVSTFLIDASILLSQFLQYL